MPWEYIAFEDIPLEGSLVLVGMPSPGMVGPLAAALVTERQSMRLVGAIQGEELPPVGLVRNGLVTSPVQVWATEMACGLDGRCDRLVVVRSDIALPPEALTPLADLVARWGAERRVGLLVALEGYNGVEAGEKADVLVAASFAGAPAVSRLDAKPLKEGALVGFGAALLVRANRWGVPAVALFNPVTEPSPEVAAHLVGLLDPLVPNISLDPAELAKQARELQGKLERERKSQKRMEKRLADSVDRGYV